MIDYCLMDNHFHLLLQLRHPDRLSALIAGLLVAYRHHDRRRYGLVGHRFQRRFKNPAVEAEGRRKGVGSRFEINNIAQRTGAGDQAGITASHPSLCSEPARQLILGVRPSRGVRRSLCWHWQQTTRKGRMRKEEEMQ
jgi:hypothetical protein